MYWAKGTTTFRADSPGAPRCTVMVSGTTG